MNLNNDHILDFQKTQRERIMKSYNTPDIQKGGEGSKGGHIIGHTKSGKPIYENSIHSSADFTHEDHSDAMSAHMKAAKEHSEHSKGYSRGGTEHYSNQVASDLQKDHQKSSQHHSSMAQLHQTAMNQKLDKTIEKSEMSDELAKAYETLGLSEALNISQPVIQDLDTRFNFIVSSLFNLQNMLEHCHRQTESEPKHEALGEAYGTLSELKDDIIEHIIGGTGRKYQNIDLTPIRGYSSEMCNSVAQEICSLGKLIEEFASDDNIPSVSNMAQDVYGVGAKLKYKLSLNNSDE